MAERTAYRADIDGLRGVAVLAVIAYHIDERLLPGGFVGVDVFFVISGFLISAQIVAGLDRGTFTLADFYRRRIKRIAPAMFAVIIATLIAAQFLMLPDDVQTLAKSSLASISGLANVYFWRFLDTSYFAPHSGQAPLLHLWTLAVEEQFYLLWPLALWILHSYGVRMLLRFAVLGAGASFLLSAWATPIVPEFAFYMLPARGGEFFAGAMVSIWAARGVPLPFGPRLQRSMSVVAGLLLAASLVMITERMNFPGYVVLAPVLATAILIWCGCGDENRMSRMLGAAPLRAVGLVSYSAYLWHWPLLAFYRYGFGSPGVSASIAIVVATLALATLSWRFIEMPARAVAWPAAQVAVRLLLLPFVAIASLSLLLLWANGPGLPRVDRDYAARLEVVRARTQPAYVRDFVCLRERPDEADLERPECFVGTRRGGPRVLLWGDSNASPYVGALRYFGEVADFSFRNLQGQSCPPMAGDPAAYLFSRDIASCRAMHDLVGARLDDWDVLVLAASWPGYQARRGDFLEHVLRFAGDQVSRGRRVILIGKAPVPEDFDRRCEAKALRWPGLDCRVPAQKLDPEIAATNEVLRAFARTTADVSYFDVGEFLCVEGSCSATDDKGRALYVDPHHLSLAGAEYIARGMVERGGVPAAFADLGANGPGRAAD